MLDTENMPATFAERFDDFIQNPTAVLSVMGAFFAIALIASAVAHLGSDARDRPR